MSNPKFTKYIIVVVSIIALLLLNSKVQTISLVDRGIVLGMGIDIEGQDIVITAQMALPGDSSSGSANKYYTVEGKGTSIIAAMEQVSMRAGLKSGYKHCSVILIGSNLKHMDINRCLEYLFDNNIVSDNTLLAISREKASEDIKKSVPNTTISSFHFRRMLNPEDTRLGINAVTLREFILLDTIEQTVPCLPLITPIKAEGVQGESSGDEENYLFEIKQAVALDKDRNIRLNEDIAKGLSIINKKITEGSLDYVLEGKKINFRLLNLKSKQKYDSEKMQVTYSQDLKVSFSDIVYENGETSGNIVDLTESDKDMLKELIAKYIESAIEFAVTNDLDILGIYDGYLTDGGKTWKENAPRDYMRQTKFEINTELTIR